MMTPSSTAFVTRHAPLIAGARHLAAALAPGSRCPVVLVTGPEGAGKSALVRHTLHRLFVDATSWVVADPGACATGRGLAAFLAGKSDHLVVLDDIDTQTLRQQAWLARRAARRARPLVLTARLDDDEPLTTLGLSPALLALIGDTVVHVPGLEQRLDDDLVPLAAQVLGADVTIERGALDELRNHTWQAHVRELNAVLLACARSTKRDGRIVVSREILAPVLHGPSPIAPPLHVAMLADACGAHETLGALGLKVATRLIEAVLIARALKSAGGNVAFAARHLRLAHSTLASRIRALAGELNAVAKWVD